MISRLALLVALLALGVAGFALFTATRDDTGANRGSQDGESASSSDTATAGRGADSAAEPDGDTTATSSTVPPDREPAATTTEPSPTPTSELPGEPFELGPAAGAALSVVGVSHDDVLNVRDAPFGEVIATLANDVGPDGNLLIVRAVPDGEIIAQIDLDSVGVVASGSTRRLPSTIWHEVTVGGVRGWVSAEYLAPLGATYDMTGEVVERVGETPTARRMPQLATKVVDALTAGGEEQPRVSVALAPSVFEGLGEIDVDVLGLADDSLRGYRLHLTADYSGDWTQADDPGFFTLRSVTARWICDSYRGTTTEGICQ